MEDLKKEILKLYEQQEAFMKEKYERSLSFQDGLFDRFERAKRLGFAEDASIYNSALVFGNVKAGVKTWIGPYVILDGSGGNIEIGNYCSISAGVHIYTHDSVMWALSGGKDPYSKGAVNI
jgi:acetyltransferase-like isoleucine patch superfamily enzyme